MSKDMNRRTFIGVGLGTIVSAIASASGHGVKEAVRKFNIIVKKAVVKPGTMIWPTRGPVPLINALMQLDNPMQPTACTCAYTLDGKCLLYCEKGKQLRADLAKTYTDLRDSLTTAEQRALLRKYQVADSAFRRHYWSVVRWTDSDDGEAAA